MPAWQENKEKQISWALRVWVTHIHFSFFFESIPIRSSPQLCRCGGSWVSTYRGGVHRHWSFELFQALVCRRPHCPTLEVALNWMQLLEFHISIILASAKFRLKLNATFRIPYRYYIGWPQVTWLNMFYYELMQVVLHQVQTQILFWRFWTFCCLMRY